MRAVYVLHTYALTPLVRYLFVASQPHAVPSIVSAHEATVTRVLTHVKEVLRKALGAHCFLLGSHALQTHVRSDHVAVSVFMSVGQERNYHAKASIKR